MSLSIKNENQNFSDRENEFPVFAMLLFKYIDTSLRNFYVNKYHKVVGINNYRYLSCDKNSKLSFLDLDINQFSTLDFVHRDKYLTDLKFLDVLKDLFNRKGPILSTQLKKIIKQMSKLQAENLEDQFSEFVSHQKPLVKETASKVTEYSISDPGSETIIKLNKERNILREKIIENFEEVVSKSSKFDTNGVFLSNKEVQIRFLSFLRDYINFVAQYQFKWNNINVIGFSECKHYLHADCGFNVNRRLLLERLLQVQIREMKVFSNWSKLKVQKGI